MKNGGVHDPVLAPVSEVLTFLAKQFAEGKQYRTINVLRFAISSAHVHVDSKPIGQHPLVVRLMRGVSICQPPLPPNFGVIHRKETLERCILNRISQHIESYIHSEQFGFVSSRSCAT